MYLYLNSIEQLLTKSLHCRLQQCI